MRPNAPSVVGAEFRYTSLALVPNEARSVHPAQLALKTAKKEENSSNFNNVRTIIMELLQ
jgi:hypothetical protein